MPSKTVPRWMLGVAVLTFMLAACGRGERSEEAGDRTYLRAHTIQQLMANVVQPTADTILAIGAIYQR